MAELGKHIGIAVLAGSLLAGTPGSACAVIADFPASAVSTTADPLITTSTSSTENTVSDDTFTSSSLPFAIDYYFRLGLYSTTPISTLRVAVGWGYPPESSNCSAIGVGSAALLRSIDGSEEWSFDFGQNGLQQSQRILSCWFSIWHAEAFWDPQVTILDARDTSGEWVDVSASLCLDCGRSHPGNAGAPAHSDYDTCGRNMCGDVVADNSYSGADALRLLRASVGLDSPKYPQQYDTDRNGRIGTNDALRVLRKSVGLPIDLQCAEPPGAACNLFPHFDQPYTVSLQLDSSDEPFSGLTVAIDYKRTAGEFRGHGASVQCESVLHGAINATNDVEDTRELFLGFIALEPFSAPINVARCTFDGTLLSPPEPSDFQITVTEAVNEDGQPIHATVSLTITEGL